jgi:hypothetical protein
MTTGFESEMLSALISEANQCVVTKQDVSLDEQKRYLKRWIDTFSIDDRVAIGNILIINDRAKDLNECLEGTIINLDALPSGVVEDMYNLAVYKHEKTATI